TGVQTCALPISRKAGRLAEGGDEGGGGSRFDLRRLGNVASTRGDVGGGDEGPFHADRATDGKAGVREGAAGPDEDRRRRPRRQRGASAQRCLHEADADG